MLKSFTYQPVTETSRPFAAAAETCGFAEKGYVEDEYFQTGTANVYEENPDLSPEILYPDAPYTTRVLIRRPADPGAFSGNVVIEILNSSANIDIDRMWVNSWPFFMRNGDIYVGISSKGHVVDALKRFDPERYAAINWANPLPDRKPPEKSHFLFLPQYESGLFWDMLIDLAELLRSDSPENPIAGYKAGEKGRYLYLTGWSQSGGYIARMIRSFHDKVRFDGYLLAGSGPQCAPMNAYCPQDRNRSGLPAGSILGAPEPVIAINTESENRHTFWYGDFDEPQFKFRTYQIAASSHDTKYNLLDYYGEKGLAELERIGIHNAYYGVDGDPLDYPYEVIFNAAFHHLYRWVREGVPAPHAPKIETRMGDKPSGDPFGSFVANKTDAFGNCKGGIRTPAADYPTGKYTSFSTCADGRVMAMFGKVNPFPPALLKLLYGSLGHYRELITEGCADAVASGFMLPEDVDGFIERVVADAEKRGLS